ncbi:DUF1775 domain-containing protein [Rubrobacter marinus]|uniref:DUF1775 domain-containing protein n=1 Tax=Rubrobacter marinus TaxID=2653852 RepID=A0A6G8PYL6_9ACTN|nr:DUF1775 domain-containing protein [Rubrobacter marinus]QIN79302.1 DUF1775 domain-containing protein [Rubrobacter marinus]
MLRALFRLALLGSLMTLAASGVAWAHVEISPAEVPQGSSQELVVEVPNESDVAYTDLELRVPEGFEVVDASAPEGFEVTADAGTIAWSGGSVPAGEAAQFTFVAQASGEPGDYAFAAIQTYEDGEVAEWTGAADSEDPAPVVAISASGAVSGGADESQHGDPASDTGAMPETGGLPLGAVALGLLGAAAAGALLMSRRRGI